MSGSIQVTASTRIEASPDVVRAQYRDMDHHIRTNVHPSIEFQWEPGAPGERKIRTTFRLLGLPQFDVAVLEDEPDGTMVIRCLEGTNAGMVVRHEFVPLDGGKATDVRLEVQAPATLGHRWRPWSARGCRSASWRPCARSPPGRGSATTTSDRSSSARTPPGKGGEAGPRELGRRGAMVGLRALVRVESSRRPRSRPPQDPRGARANEGQAAADANVLRLLSAGRTGRGGRWILHRG